ncbi:MAG: rhodoquinone biosynthesis methyltransferase RquA [bacterium]
MGRFTTPELSSDRFITTPLEACPPAVSEPDYLRRVYGWAYLHPRAIRTFERQWLVNLILWGNYAALRDAALAEFPGIPGGRILQLACVYGDLTERLAGRLSEGEMLSVAEVARIQLDNLHRKLGARNGVSLHLENAAGLSFESGSFDATLAFFLLHEQPQDIRTRTLHEAVRVLRPGGKLVIVDYHRPGLWHPLRYLMPAVFRTLEPFAMDLWRTEISDWLPDSRRCDIAKETFFGGLYQKITVVAH